MRLGYFMLNDSRAGGCRRGGYCRLRTHARREPVVSAIGLALTDMAEDGPTEEACELLVAGLDDMGIDVERRRSMGMAEATGYRPDVRTRRNGDARTVVPELMEVGLYTRSLGQVAEVIGQPVWHVRSRAVCHRAQDERVLYQRGADELCERLLVGAAVGEVGGE